MRKVSNLSGNSNILLTPSFGEFLAFGDFFKRKTKIGDWFKCVLKVFKVNEGFNISREIKNAPSQIPLRNQLIGCSVTLLVDIAGIESAAPTVWRWCSTAELNVQSCKRKWWSGRSKKRKSETERETLFFNELAKAEKIRKIYEKRPPNKWANSRSADSSAFSLTKFQS